MFFRLAFFFSIVGAQPIWERFSDFRERFQKRYASFEEFVERYEIFAENMKFIEQHNMDFTQNFTHTLTTPYYFFVRLICLE